MISKAMTFAFRVGAMTAGLALMAVAAQAVAAERVTVERNGMVRVGLPASAGSIIVANPNIADVNVVDSRTIYVIGRGYGASAVTILDRAGRPIFDGQVIVTAGQHDAVMMYKGNKPSVLVCSNVCQPAEDAAAAGASPLAQGFTSAPTISMPAGAAAPTAAAAPGAASALTQ